VKRQLFAKRKYNHKLKLLWFFLRGNWN